MKTASLPHGHSAPRNRRVPQLILTLALLAAALPALAMNPPTSTTEATTSSASPQPSLPADLPALTATNSIATPDTAPLAAQLAALQQAKDAPANTSLVKTVLQRAFSLLGTPYRWGGNSPDSGFDCSGLVGYVYRNNLGIELPRISRDMARVGELIRDRDALAEGDIVFFSRKGKHVDHVGIYLGNGQFLHAPRTGKDVEIANLASGYWAQKFLQARRVAPQQQAQTLAQTQ